METVLSVVVLSGNARCLGQQATGRFRQRRWARHPS